MKAFGGEEQPLFQSPAIEQPTDWSSDGSRIIYQAYDPTTKWDLWTYSLADHRATPLLRDSSNEKEGQLSPDGKWIAYTSDESGTFQVYVIDFPGGKERHQVSTNGGGQPRSISSRTACKSTRSSIASS